MLRTRDRDPIQFDRIMIQPTHRSRTCKARVRVPFEDARPRLYPPDEACCFVSAGAGTAMVRFLK